MDAEQFRRLETQFTAFLDRFGDCFGRKDTRAHLGVYVRGQLSDLPQKSVEPIALEAGVAPRTLQEFLSQLAWDEDRLRDRLQHIVATEQAGPHTVGLIDETSDVKKGDKTSMKATARSRSSCGSCPTVTRCMSVKSRGASPPGSIHRGW